MHFEKIYTLEGCVVPVLFEPKLIRIRGSAQLLTFLKGNFNRRTLKLIKLIKADYLLLMGKPLEITDASLMLEVWGHLYSSTFADTLNTHFKFKFIQNLSSQIKKRSDTIDCGEADVDSNRRFWDLASKLFLRKTTLSYF